MVENATKKCPFCGEMIHVEAVKCRFCREFLEDKEGLPVSHHARRGPRPEPTTGRQVAAARRTQDAPVSPDENDQPDYVLFAASPSLWGLLGSFVTAAMFLAVAVFIMASPVGTWTAKIFPNISAETAERIDGYAVRIGLGLAIIVFGCLFFQIAQLKRIRYEVNPDRIEFSRGIFSRHIDNLDMFRVVDIKLHRSLLDCITGVGAVTLVTKDETDPVFEFEKVAEPKNLYDAIKKASLAADRKQGVVHLD
ncbi:MAG: PH domain-containing protein [Planctomycetales bacterium]|nr:PH domain-containing protein [Planctomycetales bacterium]